jgi:hypothetical protein
MREQRGNEATTELPGLPIRYPVESECRHKPATTEQWFEEFTIDDDSLSRRQ